MGRQWFGGPDFLRRRHRAALSESFSFLFLNVVVPMHQSRFGSRFLWVRFLKLAFLTVGVCFPEAPLSARSPQLTQQLLAESPEELAADVLRFGDPVRGAIWFYRPELNCAKCHEPGAGLRRLGPDLTERREVTLPHLIQAVLQPSAVIRQGYETTVLSLVDGRQLSGIVVEQNNQRLLLDRIEEPTEPLAVSLEEIEDRKLTQLSTMPEGLANQLADRKEFLDLVAYLNELAKGGPPRAAELRPTTSLAALAPLPEYESHVDHRGLIAGWNGETLREGAEVYRLRCASCHGDLASEGSMPTSLRFPSGKFKRGSDPYSMYQTLTHGYGMMIPQRWMVPKQKYAVIQYIREAFLRETNPSQYVPLSEAYLVGLPAGDTLGPDPVESRPWTTMDYGPSLLNTIEVSEDRSNIAQKGLVIRLDDGPGGVESGTHWLMYDHDTLRVAGAWSGEFIDYNGIHFNGVHGQHPRVAGTVHLQNPTGPGWGRPADGSFVDERLTGRDGRHYGPLERGWAKYRGLYRFGRQTILKYTVDQTEILETPSLRYAADQPQFVRTLNFGPRSRDLILQVVRANRPFEATPAGMLSHQPVSALAPDAPVQFDGASFFQIDGADRWNTSDRDFSITAQIKTKADGTIICKTRNQEQWVPMGQSLFLRDGRPTFDVGWVGAVQANRAVNDGEWHEVAVTWTAMDRRIRFFVDGRPAGDGELGVKQPLRDAVLRIGATNDNFPERSYLQGELRAVRIFDRALSADELSQVEQRDAQRPLASWAEFTGPIVTAGPVDSVLGTAERRGRGAEATNAPQGLLVSAYSNLGQVSREQWIADAEGTLRLRIPAGAEPLRLSLAMTSLTAAADLEKVAAALASDPPRPTDLEPLTRGGPANWPKLEVTEIQQGAGSGPFVVDVLQHPEQNSGNCRLRLTGLDFHPTDVDALVVCDWDGSVWMVRGTGQIGQKAKITWRRIAAGLFQPLGIKFRDGVIYVTCRDQLVALHDLNGDGEMDWYECFNNDHQVTEHFHEFAMGLQTDAEGNFYYAKSARHALPAIVPHHGTLLKVSADGQQTEIVANGFRAANGVCLNPDGTFVVTDQEGHWNPKNRINWVRPGGFYGNMFGYHEVADSSDSAMEPPMCWITNAMDRSPGELLWVESRRWGPLSGALLNLSYGYGKIFVAPHERVDGQVQGGMCELPLPQFPTGIMRGRFSPVDGQLYCCGMFAWSSTQEQPGGLYRVRYTGQPANLPLELHARPKTFEIVFSDPLDARAAADPNNFAVKAWDLKRSANYGSEHLNERKWAVTRSELLPDGRTVRLEIPEVEPTWGMEVGYALKSKSGQPFSGKIHNTIHRLGE